MPTFDEIEGRFHDGLGTHNELCVYNAFISAFQLPQPRLSLAWTEQKINRALEELVGDPRAVTLRREVSNIERAAPHVVDILREYFQGRRIIGVRHTPTEYRLGHAGDVVVTAENGETASLSLKIDKSGRSALAEIGQTSDLYKFFQILFQMASADLDSLTQELFQQRNATEILDNFENVALLLQIVLIRRLGLRDHQGGVQANSLGNAWATNIDSVRHLFRMVKRYKNGRDDALLIIVNRTTGEVRTDSAIDAIDPDLVQLEDVSFTPCVPRLGGRSRWGTTPGVKYRGRTVFTMQVKHQRGSRASQRFRDITTRIHD